MNPDSCAMAARSGVTIHELKSLPWKLLLVTLAISGAVTYLVESNAYGLAHRSVLTILLVSPGLFLGGLISVDSDWLLRFVSFAVNFFYYFTLLKFAQLWHQSSRR